MAEVIPRQLALRELCESVGWRTVLSIIFEAMHRADTKFSDPQWGQETRLDAIGRRGALCDLVQTIYRTADLPSPLDTYYLALLAHLPAPEVKPATVPAVPEPPATKEELAALSRRRQSGSVA